MHSSFMSMEATMRLREYAAATMLRLCVVVKQDLAHCALDTAQCYWDCRESSSISYENMVKLLF